MVQERAREVYSGIKAPESLKESIRCSIKTRRARMAKQSAALVSAAACLVVVFLSGMFGGNIPLVRVDGERISEQELDLEAYVEYAAIPAAGMARGMPSNDGVSMARSMPAMNPGLRIPLEIRISQTAHVDVSVGTLLDSVEADSESNSCTELDISGKKVVYWLIEEVTEELPVCKIATEKGIFTYVIEFDETNAVYTIKQKTETK